MPLSTFAGKTEIQKSLSGNEPMARAKKLLLGLLAGLLLAVALLEASLPLLHDRFSIYFRRGITPSTLKAAEAQRFFSSKRFDPELGWDHNPVARNYVPKKRYLAQSYGDSFVESAGDLQDSWQAHFERLTGEAILNFGIGGYGLDQAVLKFEKYAPRYSTHIAIIGLYHQMYRRALSYYSFYYFANSDAFMFAFKPIFVKTDNQFELIRPPCADAACFLAIASNPDHQVWRFLARYDYWYQANQKKPFRGFPNAIKYARVLDQILQQRRELRGTENYFFVNAGALNLMEYLIERFVKDSRDMGMIPVCVMLYGSTDLAVIKSGIRLDGELLKFLVAKDIPYVDTAQYILEKYPDDDRFEGLILPDGHLNSRGNLMVAEALAQGLASMGLLEH